jgi:hypothetical protein
MNIDSIHRPFADQIQSTTRQLSFDHLQITHIDGGFKLTISSVKVWRARSLKNIRIRIP